MGERERTDAWIRRMVPTVRRAFERRGILAGDGGAWWWRSDIMMLSWPRKVWK
jgi:hypothetical protein